jgi:hypothetical protein
MKTIETILRRLARLVGRRRRRPRVLSVGRSRPALGRGRSGLGGSKRRSKLERALG